MFYFWAACFTVKKWNISVISNLIVQFSSLTSAWANRPPRCPFKLWHQIRCMVTGHLYGRNSHWKVPIQVLGNTLRPTQAGGDGRSPTPTPRHLLPRLRQFYRASVSIDLFFFFRYCSKYILWGLNEVVHSLDDFGNISDIDFKVEWSISISFFISSHIWDLKLG